METITNSNITVWWTSVQVLAINANRRYAAICNDSTNVIYISVWEDAEIWKWIRLNASWWSYEINKENLIRHDIYAIASWEWSNLTFITVE